MLKSPQNQDIEFESCREVVIPVNAKNVTDFITQGVMFNKLSDKVICFSWKDYFYDTRRKVLFQLPTETIEAWINERE